MIGGLAALILLTRLSLVQTTEFSQLISLTVAEFGENVTLTCTITGKDVGLFYWYKLNFGYMIEKVVSGTYNKMILEGQYNSSRFNITKVGDLYSLIIRNVIKEDEATYFCQAGGAYLMKFINGTILAVNDPTDQMPSVYVTQKPETASVKKGMSVNLQCSLLSTHKETRVQCPGEHRVHWFKAGSQGFHPGIIYTHSNRSDKQEERSCDYSLSKTMEETSDDGTYYCAVVTCGKILFGQGTNVETRQELHQTDIVLGALLTGCVIVIVALILYIKLKCVYEHCKGTGEVTTSSHGEHNRSAEDQPSSVDGEAALNYVALDFSSRKAKRWAANRELPRESMYAGVRDYQ